MIPKTGMGVLAQHFSEMGAAANLQHAIQKMNVTNIKLQTVLSFANFDYVSSKHEVGKPKHAVNVFSLGSFYELQVSGKPGYACRD